MGEDAELSAAYDAAQGGAAQGGTPVIDTGAHIEPDTRDGPEGPAEQQERHRAEHDLLHERVTDAWDKAAAKFQREEDRTPPMLPQMSGVDAAVQWLDMPLSERQAHTKAGELAQEVREFAKLHGITDEAANNFLMGRVAKGLDGGKSEPAAPDPETQNLFRRLAPEARSPSEAAQHISKLADHYAGIEQHIEKHGPRGWRDLVTSRGVHPAQLLSDAERAQIAAEFHGTSVGEIASRLGMVPAGDMERRITETLVTDWARSKSDYDSVRVDMAKFLQSPAFKERQGESQWQTLERVYHKVRRERARQGPAKSGMDHDIEAMADRAYGSAS